MDAYDPDGSKAQALHLQLESDLESKGLIRDDIDGILLSTAEALQNAQVHGYRSRPGHSIMLSVYASEWYAGTAVHSDNAPFDLKEIMQSAIMNRELLLEKLLQEKDLSARTKIHTSMRHQCGSLLLKQNCDVIYLNQSGNCLDLLTLRVREH